MKLNLTRKPNNNKRLTHVQLKQIKTQSKNLLITTKPNKNDPNTSNRWKPEEKTQFSSKRTSRRWSRTGEASFTSWNGSVRRVTIRVLDCSLDNDHDYRKRPCSQSLTSLQMVQASWGGEYCWLVRDSEPIRLLKSPRSLSVYILNIYIYTRFQKGWHFRNIYKYISLLLVLLFRPKKQKIYIFLKCQPFWKRVYISKLH